MTSENFPPTPHHRPYSVLEERVNALTAAAGFIAAIAFAAYILREPAAPGVPAFAFTLILLHGISTLYHAAPAGRTKAALRLADHCAIYLLIAGTYTPFALGALRPSGGLFLVALEWTLALAGIVFKFAGGMTRSHLSNAIYLGMGWAGLPWIPAVLRLLGAPVLLGMVAGGAAYTIGIAFYVARHRPYCHAIWHVFVLLGSACHAWAVILSTRL